MYQRTQTAAILRASDGAHIPADSANIDYQAYLAWVAAGNEPLPYVPPARVLPPVSRFQARAALHNAGLLPQVEALMGSEATPALARLAWQDAQEFRRDSPTVMAMAQALGLNEAALDDLFVAAAQIAA
jgi:2-hydroxychromene-2-carboxylate isomerase